MEAKMLGANAEILWGPQPKKCIFADILGFTGIHLLWKYRALGEKLP
jgi:hypothetical protein